MLSILRRSKSLKKLTCGRIAFLSQISSNELELKDNEEEKKSPELLKPRELKPFRPHFFIDLYAGVFDKSFFEYPTVLNIEEINVVLNHAQEVENYVSNKEKNAAVRQISKDVLKNLKKLNLFGLSIPKEYGGCGYTQTETKFLQECAAINFPIARLLSSNEDLGALVISTFGNEEQKRKYLPKIASGECIATLAYLEDNPIVDLTTFSTTSIKHDEKGGYLITGKKKWVHNANVSDVIIVLTRGTEISYNKVGTKMLFNLFICDRKLPGISIHELKSLRAKELNLYEVDFDKVFVKAEDFLGGEETSVHLMLQSVLSMSQVSVSTMCLSLIKQIIHSAAHYCENKVLDEKPLQEQNHVKENMGLLATYAFALESVIYMVTGRYDLYAEPELLLESSAAKILAADMLQLAIDKYIQILGPNSFKSSGLLDEALKVLQYCSVFDENNLHLKLMMSSAGVIHAAKPKAKNIKQWRKKLEFPWQAIMRQASDDFRRVDKHKLNLKLKMELHTLLQNEADKLETSLARLNNAVENHLIRFGSISLEFEQEMIKFAEAAVYIYATAACLGRASSSFCNYGKDSTCEIDMARVFTSLTAGLVERMWFDIVLLEGSSSLYKEVGKITFFNKEYPVAHPIARTD